ncbi:MAG TPA: SRPBCC domain-containing protein [Vicinamibacterales bacterium]|nr:SRPBCC domain-containing protein [Vicinamibacterales bacterium]
MRMQRACAIVAAAIAAAGVPARAAVVDSGSTGFTVKIVQHVAVPPAKVFSTAIAVGTWWSAEHSYSGVAANITIDPRAGGCWCEKLLNGGSVKHMEVVFVDPGKLLRFTGGLGPMQAMAATGSLTWEFKAAGDGTDLTWTYAVTGYQPGGFQQLAPVVDGVLASQLASLKTAAEKK